LKAKHKVAYIEHSTDKSALTLSKTAATVECRESSRMGLSLQRECDTARL